MQMNWLIQIFYTHTHARADMHPRAPTAVNSTTPKQAKLSPTPPRGGQRTKQTGAFSILIRLSETPFHGKIADLF